MYKSIIGYGLVLFFSTTLSLASDAAEVQPKQHHVFTKIDHFFDDSEVTARVKAKLIEDSHLKIDKLSVTTDNGVVTVTGFVTSMEQVRLTHQAVNSVQGVKKLNSQLRVRKEKKTTLKGYARDVATTSEIKALMFANKKLNSRHINVNTRHGEVFLTGTVESAAQKQLAESIVKGVSSVQKVKNELQTDKK